MDTAESMARAVLSLPALIPQFTSMARMSLALLAAHRKDAVAAAEHYSALKGMAGITLLYASTDRVLGLLAHTLGDYDHAVRHYEDALDFCRKGHQPPELAWSLFDYSDALLARNQPGDRAKAHMLLEEAHTIGAELGMMPLVGRVVTRLQSLDAQRQSARPVYPGGLSQREVEVLRMVALGKSNHEIAEGLGIAEGTVRRHVSNIYVKIGATNRTEATRYALKEALLSLDHGVTRDHGVARLPE